MIFTGKLKNICFYNRALFLLALDPACETSGKSILVENISLKYPRIIFPDAGSWNQHFFTLIYNLGQNIWKKVNTSEQKLDKTRPLRYLYFSKF